MAQFTIRRLLLAFFWLALAMYVAADPWAKDVEFKADGRQVIRLNLFELISPILVLLFVVTAGLTLWGKWRGGVIVGTLSLCWLVYSMPWGR